MRSVMGSVGTFRAIAGAVRVIMPFVKVPTRNVGTRQGAMANTFACVNVADASQVTFGLFHVITVPRFKASQDPIVILRVLHKGGIGCRKVMGYRLGVQQETTRFAWVLLADN